MLVQTWSTRVKASAPAFPANEKATLNLLGRVGFDRPLEVFNVETFDQYLNLSISENLHLQMLIMKIIRA